MAGRGEGSAVDFGYLQQGAGHALDPIANALDDYASWKTKKRQDDAQMAEKRLQNDREYNLKGQDVANRTAREAREERKLNAQQEVQNSGRRSEVDAKIRAAVANGDMATARQLSNDYAEVNPADASVTRGRQFEVKTPDVGSAPVAPAPGPTSIEYGPRETPEIASQAAIARTKTSPDDPNARADEVMQRDAEAQSERERFAKANDPGEVAKNVNAQSMFANQTDAYNQKVSNARLNPAVSIGGVETSTDELRHSASRQAAQDFDKVGQALQSELSQALQSGDPLLRSQAQRRAERYTQLRAGVESGVIKPFDALKQMNAGADLADKYQESRHHDTTVGEYGLERQRIANQKPPSGFGTSAKPGPDPKAIAATESALEHFQKNFNVSANRTEDAKLHSLINNSDKAIVQRAITSVLSRGLAGEKGVLTDQDINRLQKNLGGAWNEVQNWASKGATGELSNQTMAKLKEGIDTVLQQHDELRTTGKAAYDKTFGGNSPYAQWGLGEHLKNKRAEFFGDDAAGGAGGGESKEQRIQRLKAILGQ